MVESLEVPDEYLRLLYKFYFRRCQVMTELLLQDHFVAKAWHDKALTLQTHALVAFLIPA